MNKKTLMALKQRIEIWEKKARGIYMNKIGYSYCPLCKLFGNRGCVGCPVREKTGEKYCVGTPYYKYYDERTKRNARKMVDFLKALLPKRKK